MTGPTAPAALTAPATLQEFRRFVAQHHPDRGGDPEHFNAGVRAWRDLQAGPPNLVFYRKRALPVRLLHRLPMVLCRPSRRGGSPTERRVR